MDKLKVKIKSSSRRKYRIKGDEIAFEQLEDKIRTTILQEQFDRTVKAARNAGMSKLTRTEINSIVRDIRSGA